MTAKHLLPLAVVALLAGGVLGTTARADQAAGLSDAALIAAAKISLAQAIVAAEQHSNGHAVGAGIDNQNGTVQFAVEVATGLGTQTVLVDPNTGSVTAVQAGSDQGSDGEHQD